MEVLNGGYLVRLLFISLLDLFKKATKKMNIKPVGHFYPEGEGATVYDIKFAWKVTGTTEPIPLYTHPAKELTDEEIWKLWQKHLSDDIPVFARAILRKAQEK